MPESLEITPLKTQWMKIKDLRSACFVGQEAVAYGYGSHIFFTNLTTGVDSFYRADSKENGDGISCLAGHKVFSIFAFAELGWNARIFILSYPDFTKVSVLENKEECLYISLSFSETEHLISLTGMPDYKIQVWYWRTQDLLTTMGTEMVSDKQKISCSPSLPLTVCQLAYNKALLIVWEVHGTQKFCKLIKRKINLPFSKKDAPCDICYSIEGNIHLVNKKGDVYHIIPSSGSVSLIAKWNGEKGSIPTCIAYCKGGILVSGSDGTLKHLKKQKYVWNEIFQKTPPEPFVLLKGYHENDLTIGATAGGQLVKLFVDGQHIDFLRLKEYDCSFKYFSLVHPMGKHILTVSYENNINVFCVESGQKISTIPVIEQTYIKSNPAYPYAAVGDCKGSVFLVSLLDIENPKILTEFHLSHFRIEKIIFSKSGETFIASDEESNIFVMRGVPGEEIKVICHYKEESQIIPEFILETNDLLTFYIMKNSEDSGTYLSKFLVPLHGNGKDKLEKTEIHFHKSLTKLLNVPGHENLFYTAQQMSKNVEIIRIVGEKSFETVKSIETPHQLKSLQFNLCGRYLYTWGTLDGIISIFDTQKNHELVAKFVAHNRHTFGVKKASMAFNQFFITLGHSKNIVCTKLDINIENQFLQKADPTWKQIFMTPTIGFIPSGANAGKKYLDLQTEQTFIMEVKESEETRKIVVEELEGLKRRLKLLLDQNESCSAEEKLEIQDFNIDVATTEQMQEEAKQQRDQEKGRMLEYIRVQTQVNNWIIEKCWKPIAYKGQRLRGIFTKIFVENFPMLPEKGGNKIEKIRLMREIENSVAFGDNFIPWRPIPSLDLEKLFSKEPTIRDLDSPEAKVFPNQMNTLMGTTSYRFFEPSPLHYQQMDIISFHQMYIEKCIIENEILNMKKQFNKKFDELRYAKKLDINSIKVKNDRLRNIRSEIRAMEEVRGKTVHEDVDFFIPDPAFLTDEIPETSVITVQDAEVTAPKYVTPSFHRLFLAEKAAREKRRLELEADDFRDRALDAMMDGVLEHRWEDEIKKSPKMPECMFKDRGSREYNDTELKEIAEYNAKVSFLSKERERYHEMLEEEQITLKDARDYEIKQFNYRIGEISFDKNKLDAAIAQEEMKLLMMTQYNFKRMNNQQEEMRIRGKIEHVKETIENLTQIQTEIQDKITDIKNNYENLNAKDKQLDKQFKANFSEAAPAAPVDQAYKYFKRRPKLQMRAQITSPILQELARRVTSKKVALNAKLLPSECLEYLNGIDTLDQIASSTTGIDPNSWQILCKMRRIKIESEFKIKGVGLQLADAEATSMAYGREINNKRNYLQTLEKSLVEMRENRDNETVNRFVQIVMKRGLIEIPLSGSFSDFQESVLIHRSDVDDINKVIKKAGTKKLKAMKNSAEFRRKIITKEWEHKVLKLKVRDLKEQVKTIEKCKITKEVQMWLKWKEKGWTEDLGEQALNREVENAINMQEKLLNETLRELNNLETQINNKIRENKMLDKKIRMLNIDVAEKNYMRDVDFERDSVRSARDRMRAILERAKIVRVIQQQHTHILELSTLLELQRLKTYPTLSAHSYSTKFIKLNN